MSAAPSPRLVRWALTAALASLPGACTSQKPPAPPPAPSPSSPVPPEATFALSQVRFQYQEDEALKKLGIDEIGRLKVSYTVRNQRDGHAGAAVCFDLIDKEGYLVAQSNLIDRIGLRARDSETLVDEGYSLTPEAWAATEVLRFYMSKDCSLERKDLRSAVLFMNKSGQLLPPESQSDGKLSATQTEDIPLWFNLKDARLVQDERGEVRVSYTLTNLTKGRASGRLCARLTTATRCTCQSLDQAETSEIDLGLGASTRKSSLLDLKDNAHWGQGQQILLYMATFGCSTLPEQANSNVLTVSKPRSIEAPEPPPPPESSDD